MNMHLKMTVLGNINRVVARYFSAEARAVGREHVGMGQDADHWRTGGKKGEQNLTCPCSLCLGGSCSSWEVGLLHAGAATQLVWTPWGCSWCPIHFPPSYGFVGGTSFYLPYSPPFPHCRAWDCICMVPYGQAVHSCLYHRKTLGVWGAVPSFPLKLVLGAGAFLTLP